MIIERLISWLLSVRCIRINNENFYRVSLMNCVLLLLLVNLTFILEFQWRSFAKIIENNHYLCSDWPAVATNSFPRASKLSKVFAQIYFLIPIHYSISKLPTNWNVFFPTSELFDLKVIFLLNHFWIIFLHEHFFFTPLNWIWIFYYHITALQWFPQ